MSIKLLTSSSESRLIIDASSLDGSLTSAIILIKPPFEGNMAEPLSYDFKELLSAGVQISCSFSKVFLIAMPLLRAIKNKMDNQKTLHV